MIRFFNTFTKITAYPVQKACFNTKILYEDKSVQNRRIKGSAIVVSNHTSVYDYAVLLFVFFSRTVRYQMAEVLFKKKFLGVFLKMLGGIKVDRGSHDFAFMDKCEKILEKGGCVGIFPESRLPVEGEEKPLAFKPGAVTLALTAGVPVIPVYTNGCYFGKVKVKTPDGKIKKQRAKVIIGTPVYPSDMYDENKSEKQNIEDITAALRQKIIKLGRILNEKEQSIVI